MKQEVITTNRLLLEPFSEKYLTDEYVSWLNDETVVKYSELRHRKHTLIACREYYKSFENSSNLFWAIVFKSEPNVHIGNMTAHIDLNNNIADLGILIGNQDYWGMGLGLEAWLGVCNSLLTANRIRKITAGTLENNQAMLRIMQRSGMQPDGLRIKHFVHNDKFVDVIHYCLFNR